MACTPSRPLPAHGSPDIILVTIDTLRADRLGYVGHPAARTPHLDALAQTGRVYTQATTPLTRTTPALASLLTGRDPRGHGSWEVGAEIDRTVPLLSERLHDAGWATIAVSGSPVASPKQGLGRGFETFRVLDDPPASEAVALALDLVAEVESRRPVFLWVHMTDPHFPYRVRPGDPAAGQTRLCDALGRRFSNRPRQRWRIFANQDGASAAALEQCQRAYDTEVTAADAAIGQLLAGLDSRASGLVVMTSDHGENQGEGGLWYEHGPDAHDATLRIPLIIRSPELAQSADNDPARIQDITPTILSQVGLPPLDGVAMGTDLLSNQRPEAAIGLSASALHAGLTNYLRSGRAHKRHCLNGPPEDGQAISLCSDGAFDRTLDPTLQTPASPTEATTRSLTEAAEKWPPEQARQWVARTPTWKLIADPSLTGQFDLRLVPVGDEDAPDQSSAHPEVRASLEATLRHNSAGAGVPSPGSTTTSTDGLSPEDDAALKTLGYIE